MVHTNRTVYCSFEDVTSDAQFKSKQEYFCVTRGSLGRDRPVEVILEKERLI